MIMDNMICPITPTEAADEWFRINKVPINFMITTINKLIMNHYYNRRSVITQPQIISQISANYPDGVADVIFKNQWPDVADIFRKAGWSIEFIGVTPYNATGHPYFVFSH